MKTPIRLAPAGITSYMPVVDLYDANGDLVCDLQSSADAAHIVKCVNAHDKLVEALENVEKDLHTWADDWGRFPESRAILLAEAKYIKAILAKVSG